jgi:hypothetical protein
MMDESVELTGNDYVSMPFITRSCAMDGVNVLHGGLGGLIEWTGAGIDAPLFRPELIIDGTTVSLQSASWRRLDRWIPTFQLTLPDGIALHGTICAPGGYPPARGALLRFELENRGRTNRQIALRLHINWNTTNLWIATGRRLEGVNRLLFDGSCVSSVRGASVMARVLQRMRCAGPVPITGCGRLVSSYRTCCVRVKIRSVPSCSTGICSSADISLWGAVSMMIDCTSSARGRRGVPLPHCSMSAKRCSGRYPR